MYIIVVGCGKIGYHVAKALLATGQEVLIIEQDSRLCEQVCEELGSIAIAGDGTEAGVLAEAGANRCDVLIAVTGFDEDNLVACQMAKWRFGVARTIALVNNPQNVALFKALGIDVTVSNTDIILTHIEEELPAHPLIHVLPLKESNRELVGIRVPPDAAVVGMTIDQVQLPQDSLISLVIGKDGQPHLPNEEVQIQANDEVVAVTTPDKEDDLLEALTKASEE